jgi:hypothetical protein
MKIKGKYEVEFNNKDWWFVIILITLIVSLFVGNIAPVNILLETLEKKLNIANFSDNSH